MRGQPGFFDIDDRLKRLSDLGDQLETFRLAVDFELFRPELNAVLSYADRTEGGRPPFDPVLMFKILVIQATNNLSDERAFSSMIGCRLCGSWDWGWRTVFQTPARSGCSGRS
jgi:IS5 family transposase